MASLQDQLLKAGIVDQKKAKKIKQDKRKQAKKLPKGEKQVDENKQHAKQALADKAQRDRDREKLRQDEVQKKAIHAQVVQLVRVNTINRQDGETAYQFSDNNKIKKIYVTNILHRELSTGRLAIAKLNDQYALIPRQIAEKIEQRESNIIVLLNSSASTEIEADDPYADYQIPDDLMW